MTKHEHTNRLIDETSPYLLQHAHNPVDWYPWGEEALQQAKAEEKPILLSVGYSACHWCHVMERESFENEEIAKLMNEHYICIKVDREERPDIDHIYMSAVQMMAGQGGWPMTVFLTPEGKPFYGGTYYPPEDRYGRPGFPRILQAVSEAWRERRSEIEEQGGAMVEQMQEMSRVDLPETAVTTDLFEQAVRKLKQNFDDRLGGFGGAPKFPQPMTIDFLLRFAHRTGNKDALHMATFTLERMAMGGIYDQLGGGFHRYSTDEYWLAPHFEKMLYDNAQLAQSYLRAWQATGETFFRHVAVETLDYVAREMTSPTGGFYSAQDADSEGEEGRFFVWTDQEIKQILGVDDAALFTRYYDVTPRGNWEGKNILNMSAPAENFARSLGIEAEAFQERIDGMRQRLLNQREMRVKPHRDDKILTAWNGLMLAAFAEAAAVLDRPDYRKIAEANAEFVLEELYHEGRLLRTGKDVEDPTQPGALQFKVAPITGFLEDYSYFIDGLLRLYEATFEWRWLDAAKELATTMLELFLDEEGSFYNTPHDAEALVDRPRDMMDNATPSGNSVAVDGLLRLATLTADPEYHRVASSILRKTNGLMAQHPQSFGRLLSAADFYVGPVKELAIIGELDSRETKALLTAARATYQPNMLVVAANPEDMRIPELPLLADRPEHDGHSTAYLCENYACQQPTTDPAILAEQLNA